MGWTETFALVLYYVENPCQDAEVVVVLLRVPKEMPFVVTAGEAFANEA